MPPTDASARALTEVLLADVVLPRGGSIWLEGVRDVLGELGVSDAAARQAARRLAADGIVEAHRDGRRSRYAMTGAGRQHLAELLAPVRADATPAWDGQWRVLVYTFPEADRAARDQLRRELTELGHGSTGTGTWVTPWDLGPRLDQRLAAHRAAGRVDRFVARHDGDDRDLARRAFDLDAHAASLQAFVAAHRDPTAPASDVAAVARRVLLLHDWVVLRAAMPTLPPQLLPDDWPGDEVAADVRSALGQLEPAVDRWWQAAMAPASAPRPAARAATPAARPAPTPPAAPARAPADVAAPATSTSVPVPAPSASTPWSGLRRTIGLSLADDALVLAATLAAVPDHDDPASRAVVEEVADGLRGLAAAWHTAVAGGSGRAADLVGHRSPDQWRHAAGAEAPMTGTPDAVARAHVGTHALRTWLEALSASADAELASMAEVSLEAGGELVRSVEAVLARRARDARLALATNEAATHAVDLGVSYFESLPGEAAGLDDGTLPEDTAALRAHWWEDVDRALRARGLVVTRPRSASRPGGRRGLHDPSFVTGTWTRLARVDDGGAG